MRRAGAREEGKRPEAPQRVGDLLPRLLDDLGIAGDIAAQEALVLWPSVVGEKIAAVTNARSIDSGVLFVDVRSSAWLSELNMMRHKILGRINAGRRVGRIERIVFSLSEAAPGMERRRPDR